MGTECSEGMRRYATLGLLAASALVLAACGGGGGEGSMQTGQSADTTDGKKGALALPAKTAVPRAVCGPNDHPESGLQGQVPKFLRTKGGFNGFNCNLQLVGQSRGDGASWQHAFFQDSSGHRCSYYDTRFATTRPKQGTVVIDVTDNTNPTPTAYLTTRPMLDPWESLKVNERRQILGAEDGRNGTGTAQLDLYDISSDCRFPQLLSSVITGTAANGDAAALPPGQNLAGHEGGFSPDGLTWYSGDRGTIKKYTATDLSDATHPKLMATWTLPQSPGATTTTHGLSISDDGMRAYVSQAFVGDASAGATARNGVLVLDVSDFQNRVPNPQFRQLGSVLWLDGGQIQHTIPITVNGKRYVVAADEAGSAGNSNAGYQAACNAGLSPFPMARIIDISDETNPFVVSKLALEIHSPNACSLVLPDLVGISSFTYGSHYCSVDNRQNATTLACGYFEAGIRVFDIRNPLAPREIAYYNPPSVTTASAGSQNNSGSANGRPDHCTAQIRLDAVAGTLHTTCQDNGFLSLKFTNGVWPFPTSSTPPGMQN